jgi:hypothetical protein
MADRGDADAREAQEPLPTPPLDPQQASQAMPIVFCFLTPLELIRCQEVRCLDALCAPLRRPLAGAPHTCADA